METEPLFEEQEAEPLEAEPLEAEPLFDEGEAEPLTVASATGQAEPLLDQDGPEPLSEGGSMFGLVDQEDLGRFASGVSTFFEEAGKTFFERMPKSAAVVFESLKGPDFRGQFEQAQKLAEEEGIGIEEALKRQEPKSQGAFNAFLGPGPGPDRIEDNPLYQIGNEAGEFLEELFPENPEFQDEVMTSMLPRMAGQLTSFVGGAAGISRLGVPSSLAASGIGSSVLGSEEYERAKEAGADDDEAFNAFLGGVAAGGLEGLPVGRFFKRLDDFSNGFLRNRIGEVGARTVNGVFEEAGQEAITQTLLNASAGQTYDKTRELLEGVGTAAALGGALGGTLNAAGTALARKFELAETKAEAAELKEAETLLTERSRELQEQSNEPVDLSGGPVDSAPGLDTSGRTFRDQDPDEVDPNQQTFPFNPGTPFEQTWRGWKQWFGNMFTSRGKGKGVLPEEAAKLDKQRERRVRAQVREMENNVRALQGGLEVQYGDEVPEEAYSLINEALTNKQVSIERYPEGIREPLFKMRTHVDRLSRELIREGVAEGKLAAKIEENIGTYLTRIYKKHEVENYAAEFNADENQDLINSVVAHIRERYKKGTGSELETEKLQIIKELLDADEAEVDYLTATESGTSINWDLLRKRKDIPAEIRDLFGEFDNGAIRYARTIQKMANTLETFKFQRDFRNIGLEQGWLYSPDKFVPGAKKIASDNSEVMKPLTDDRGRPYQADPEIADAFNEVRNDLADNRFFELFFKANGYWKAAKTVFNFTTHMKNSVGGAVMMMNNGHGPWGKPMRQAFNAVREDVRRAAAEEQADFLRRAEELGLLDASARGSELEDLLLDTGIKSKDSVADIILGPDSKGSSHIYSFKRMAQRSAQTVANLYQAEDNLFRLAFFRKEAEQYADAFYGKKFDELDAEQRTRVEEYAGEITRGNYQNYNNVPQFIRSLRRAPFSNFASFQYEMLRTGLNTARLAAEEIRSSNPKIKKIGAKRMAGLLAMSSGLAASGAAAAGSMMFGVNTLEEDMTDVRELAAPWDENGALMPISRTTDDQGNPVYRYYNISQLDPYTLFNNPIRAALRGAEDDEIIETVVEESRRQLEPFIDPNLLVLKANEVYNNQTEEGGRVYQPSAGTGRKLGAVAAHMLELYEPSTIKNSIDLAQYYTNEGYDPATGQIIRPGDEVLGIFGARISTTNIGRSFGFEARAFRKKIGEDRDLFNVQKFRDRPNVNRMVEDFKNANRNYEERIPDMRRKIQAAYRLGMSWDKIESTLKEADIAQEERDRLLRGVQNPLLKVEDFFPEPE